MESVHCYSISWMPDGSFLRGRGNPFRSGKSVIVHGYIRVCCLYIMPSPSPSPTTVNVVKTVSLALDSGRDIDSHNMILDIYQNDCIQKCQAISTDIYITRTFLATKNGLTTNEQDYDALKVKILQRLRGVFWCVREYVSSAHRYPGRLNLQFQLSSSSFHRGC